MMRLQLLLVSILLVLQASIVSAFRPSFQASPRSLLIHQGVTRTTVRLLANEKDEQESNDGVVELVDDAEKEEEKVVAPFASQIAGIDPDALKIDLSDGKQTRVIIYVLLSLLPVLFLIPFMLSRDLIPLDQLPPVDIN
jgi:hypothetical protein